jgi:hypothetical protein
MSETAHIGLAPPTFLAALDRVLMANARIAARNGDLPYFGL